MPTSPVNYSEIIRFYERLTRLKPGVSNDYPQIQESDFLNISAEAKKKFVYQQALSEVLERIKK